MMREEGEVRLERLRLRLRLHWLPGLIFQHGGAL
jgi:hypothetical protein